MSPGECIKWQPQVHTPMLCWAVTAGWKHPCPLGAGGGTTSCHFCPQAVCQHCARCLRVVPCPPTPTPMRAQAMPSMCHPCHPPCAALSLPSGAGAPMGARHMAQRALLGVLCWGGLTASPAQEPAAERGARVLGTVPVQDEQGRCGGAQRGDQRDTQKGLGAAPGVTHLMVSHSCGTGGTPGCPALLGVLGQHVVSPPGTVSLSTPRVSTGELPQCGGSSPEP